MRAMQAPEDAALGASVSARLRKDMRDSAIRYGRRRTCARIFVFSVTTAIITLILYHSKAMILTKAGAWMISIIILHWILQ